MRTLNFLLILIITCSLGCRKNDKCLPPVAEFSIESPTVHGSDTLSLTNLSREATRFRWEIVPLNSPDTVFSYFAESGSPVFIGNAPRLILREAATIKLTAANDCYESSSFEILIGGGNWAYSNNITGEARMHAANFSIGDKHYVGTGNTTSSMTSVDFWEYNPITNSWSQIADLPGVARTEAIGFSIGNKGYIGTGLDNNSNPLRDFWEWDQASNTWLRKADYGGVGTAGAIGFSIGTMGYIGTGYTTANYTTQFWQWDQASDTWTQKASVGNISTSGRYSASCFSIGTKGYVCGGLGPTGRFMNDLWEWDQLTNTWTRKSDFPGIGRMSSIGVTNGQYGYYGLGWNPYTYVTYDDIWEWDPSSDTWFRILDYPYGGMDGATAFSSPSGIYTGLGRNSSYMYNQTFFKWNR